MNVQCYSSGNIKLFRPRRPLGDDCTFSTSTTTDLDDLRPTTVFFFLLVLCVVILLVKYSCREFFVWVTIFSRREILYEFIHPAEKQKQKDMPTDTLGLLPANTEAT